MDREARTIRNPVIDDVVTFIETSAESGGRHSVVEIELAPGGNNPIHFHTDFTETFEPIEGELGLHLDGEELRAGPGDSRTVERRIRHRFYNPGNEPVRFRCILRPGSTAFEHCLMIAYGLARDGLTNRQSLPRDLEVLGLLCVMGNSRFAGVSTLISPFMNFLASRARKKGKDIALIEKYVIDFSELSAGVEAASVLSQTGSAEPPEPAGVS